LLIFFFEIGAGWTKLDGTATLSVCEIPHNNDENHMPERSPANLVVWKHLVDIEQIGEKEHQKT